jgi:hypothetical protein
MSGFVHCDPGYDFSLAWMVSFCVIEHLPENNAADCVREHFVLTFTER